jgi:hypothetical protein
MARRTSPGSVVKRVTVNIAASPTFAQQTLGAAPGSPARVVLELVRLPVQRRVLRAGRTGRAGPGGDQTLVASRSLRWRSICGM